MRYSQICAAVVAALLLASCATAPQAQHHQIKARVTFYRQGEDKWGRRVACSSKLRAVEGVTCAAESSIPFGTRVYIPRLKGVLGSGVFTVQDRGGAVERRKASRGLLPVLDLFVSRRMYRRLIKELEPVMEVLFL